MIIDGVDCPDLDLTPDQVASWRKMQQQAREEAGGMPLQPGQYCGTPTKLRGILSTHRVQRQAQPKQQQQSVEAYAVEYWRKAKATR